MRGVVPQILSEDIPEEICEVIRKVKDSVIHGVICEVTQ